jgi:ankyrin repeat protein
MKKKILLLVVLLVGSLGLAQENVFLQRSYWKANPSIEAVENAISEGNDATQLNPNMFDGVCYAILEQADNATIKHLIGKKGNEVDKITHDGRTYIFWAAYKGNLELVKWLVDQGARADIEDSHGYTVLNFAANAGQSDTELFDFLLAHKADIKATTRNGANALLLVTSGANDMAIVDYFLDKGLAFDSVDDTGNGIFQYAAKGGNLEVLKALEARGANVKLVNSKGENALFRAASGTRSKQHPKAAFAYLEGLGLDASITNKDGQNLLHLLANRNKEVAVFQHYLDKGLDANAQDANGSTSLMNAARGNSLEVVKLLVNGAEDINVQDEKGRSALAMAVSRSTPEVVGLLLENGADSATADKKGNTLAYYLMQSYDAKKPEDFEAKWKLLNKVGLSMSDTQHDGNSLLHLAAKDNDMPLLQRLEEFDIDINQKNDEGNTPLHLAAMSAENTEILKYLIAQGADVALKTDFEETVYDLAKENELLQKEMTALEFLQPKNKVQGK